MSSPRSVAGPRGAVPPAGPRPGAAPAPSRGGKANSSRVADGQRVAPQGPRGASRANAGGSSRAAGNQAAASRVRPPAPRAASRVAPGVAANANGRVAPSRAGVNRAAVPPRRSRPAPARAATPVARAQAPAPSRVGLPITTVASRSFQQASPKNARKAAPSARGRAYSVWHDHYHPTARHTHYHPSFWRSVNYAYRPSVWGPRPWWGARSSYSWHHGSWNYGWNNHWHHRYAYYRRPALYYPPGYRVRYTSFVPWGLASWTLGRLAYDTGYYHYYNPYVTAPVSTHTTVIRYSEPITVIASKQPEVSEEAAATAAEASAAALDRARTAFHAGDYLTAASAAEEAISLNPGDPVPHEFRALTLFALGRYDDAAGVLHSVLASGPGWDWETLIGNYGDPDRYTDQLRKLEDYVLAHPDSPAPHFLLGYHYLVGENLPEAHQMFDRVATLQPADSVATQLRSLLSESAPSSEEPELAEEQPAAVEADKAPIAAEALHGVWTAPSADGKPVTLSLTPQGTFTWNYAGAENGKVLSGEWSLDEDGLLVLKDEDVQMIGDIALNPDGSLHFLLAGSPEDDPGLTFRKQ